MLHDLSIAWRALRRAPWYAATVVLVLGTGMALTTLTFAIADGVLFKPLPYPNADELYLIRADTTSAPRLDPPAVTWDEIRVWREAVPELAIGVSRVTARPEAQIAVRDYYIAEVDEHFLDVLGVKPFVGKHEAVDLSALTTPPSMFVYPRVISHSLWRGAYNADPSVIGRVAVTRDSRGRQSAVRVTGILPPGFAFPVAYDQPQPDVLVPVWSRATRGQDSIDTRQWQAIVRIEATGELTGIRQRLLAATLEWGRLAPTALRVGDTRLAPPFDRITLVPLAEHIGRKERPALAMVVSGAGLLLVLVCLNVAGLAAARAVERERETAVRRALGAAPWRLVRAQLAEFGWLTGSAMAVALCACQPLLLWTVDLLPASLAPFEAPALSSRVFAAAALAGALSLLVVSLWPVRQTLRTSLVGGLGRSAPGVARPVRSQRVLISAQTAGGFVLLMTGGLTAASLLAVWNEDTGYERHRLAVIEASVAHYATLEEATERLEEVRRIIQGTPGVEDVAIAWASQVFGSTERRNVTNWVPHTLPDESAWTFALHEGAISRAVTSNFFDVLGLDLVEGVWPDPKTWDADGPVALVSESVARRWWPGRPALGQVLARVPVRTRPTNPPRVVVGVVRDVRYAALDREPVPTVYIPNPIGVGSAVEHFLVRTTADAETVLPGILQTLSTQRLQISDAQTFEAGLLKSVRHRALPAWLFGLIGGAGLIVLGISIVGLLAMSVGQRRREIGIRLALGSTGVGIVRLLASEQLRPVVSGLGVGALAALWAVRFLESQLYGVGIYHPGVWFGSALMVLTMALAGTLIPSVRSAAASPVDALRAE